MKCRDNARQNCSKCYRNIPLIKIQKELAHIQVKRKRYGVLKLSLEVRINVIDEAHQLQVKDLTRNQR